MLFNKFAVKKVRFIAVLDDIDMLYWNEWDQDFFIPFQTLMNQAYSMDISQKISSQLKENANVENLSVENPYTGTSDLRPTGTSL